MNSIVFSLPGNENLCDSIAEGIKAEKGVVKIHAFPDGESLVCIDSDCVGKEVIVVASLDHPDDKILPLYFLCKKLNTEGAIKLTLVAPYLAYMRQDKAFHEGEVISANYFAALISSFTDHLITVDPHLHRHQSLSEIFSIPSQVVHTASAISEWIKSQVVKPILIGPDAESSQWVAQVANTADAPHIILSKQRIDDVKVEITLPEIDKYPGFTPVVVDDIISTAQTMIETVNQLKKFELRNPVCIGIHPVFANSAYQRLLNTGIQKVITCNTIPHISNGIKVDNLIITILKETQD